MTRLVGAPLARAANSKAASRRADSASVWAAPPSTTGRPGKTTGREVISSCSLAKVTTDPENDTAPTRIVNAVAAKVNPKARVLRANSPATCEKPELVKGKRVLVIEDGPTLTHGGMTYGAGVVAAKKLGAAEIVDPTPYAVGSIKATYEKYPNAEGILPAMGYSPLQIAELEATIEKTPCDAVVSGTPIDLTRVLKIGKPATRVRYELEPLVPGLLEEEVRKVIR